MVYDLRSDDVAAGGQGAPLAPVYHAALVRFSGLHTPTAVLNLGGVANVTLVKADGSLEAFDTGPANGMIDLLVQAHTDRRFDEGGALPRAGRVDEAVLAAYLNHPYFSIRGPKSLDRFDFSLQPVDHLSLEDAAATLTAFAGEAVARGVKALPEIPLRLVVAGGGRRNPALMNAIRERAPVPVLTAEDAHWRGDSIEAEAFAYLAARAMLKPAVVSRHHRRSGADDGWSAKRCLKGSSLHPSAGRSHLDNRGWRRGRVQTRVHCAMVDLLITGCRMDGGVRSSTFYGPMGC